MFSLGCIFHYTISNKVHLFGNTVERTFNIENNNPNFDNDVVEPKYRFILPVISRMVAAHPSSRIRVAELLVDPVFWNDDQTADFLKNAYKYVCMEPTSVLHLDNLEDFRNWLLLVDTSTREYVKKMITGDQGTERLHCGTCATKELLYTISTLIENFNQMPESNKEILGGSRSSTLNYFQVKFPFLIDLLQSSPLGRDINNRVPIAPLLIQKYSNLAKDDGISFMNYFLDS